MIKTSRQLKDLIRNKAKGDSDKSGLLIRNYGMERFLERVTLSKYKDNFILKGGMLVAAMVGLDNRATMDIDTSIHNLPLDTEHAKKIVEEIAAVKIDDNIRFEIKDISNIMDEAEYGGVRHLPVGLSPRNGACGKDRNGVVAGRIKHAAAGFL